MTVKRYVWDEEGYPPEGMELVSAADYDALAVELVGGLVALERIAQLEARVAALTKFAEFCDYHHRSCTGLQGQHLECDCGYSDARDELRDALAQAEKTKETP